MRKKMIWGFAALILLIGAVGFLFYRQSMEIKQLKEETAKDEKLLKQHPTPNGVEGGEDTSHPDFHIHADGTPHIGTHDEPKVEYTAPEGAVLKPDFSKVASSEDLVKAAYKRLEYIKNNPYAWGGVHSPRATELIAQLMPPPELIDHEHGDQVIEQIEELSEQGDPRAAEVLIAHICDGDTLGPSMTEALEEIGPPAVPYVLAYVRENSVMTAIAVEVLGRIGARYRDDLGEIVDHIIIPKLEVIVADNENERYDSGSVIFALEALTQLR